MPDQNSDAAEFTRYYEQHKHEIFNYILYRVGFNRYTAEDLTSEIFLKAFEHFDSFDRSRSFKSWVFTIAHNHLVNYLVGKKETLPIDDARELVKVASTVERVEQAMLLSKVLSLVSRLPDSRRELIILRYVNDLTIEEIADITGKEQGAIRTALSRAIASLRSQYNAGLAPKKL